MIKWNGTIEFIHKGLTYKYSSTRYYYGLLYEKINDLDNALLEYKNNRNISKKTDKYRMIELAMK